MKAMVHLFVFLFIASCAHNPSLEINSCVENRSAIDIGSGATKFKIFAINRCEKKIISVVYEEDKSIPFKEDLEQNSNQFFSTNIQNQLKDFLQKIQSENKKYNVVRSFGVATEAFRKSQNGHAVITEIAKSFDLSLKVITQEEEARLGFLSASSKFPEIKSAPSVVWDIGGGSMQITVNSKSGMHYYFGKLASVSFKNLVIEKIKRKKDVTSPNPLLKNEVEKAMKLSKELALRELKSIKSHFEKDILIVGVGGVFQHSLLKQMGLKDQFTEENLAFELQKRTGFTDLDFKSDYASTELTNLILVKGFMNELKIKKISVGKVNLTEGLAIESLF